jgi:hypothetical protein
MNARVKDRQAYWDVEETGAGMDELPRRAREEPEVKHGTGITDDIASGTTSWQDNHRRTRADSECAKRRRWPQICRDLQP